MTIIVFLIDTSASMFQRTYIGGRTTLLDVAKSAVETFVKIRQRSMDSRIDRYMLLTFEETPNNIKAGWKENLGTFMNELKNLQCHSMTTMGVAVKQAFDILNINRMTSGIDTYGQGRCPFFLETSIIVLITDGGKLTSVNGVHEDFNLPMHSPIPGSEMTREPFRWDQRLFALVLRLTGTPAIERDTGLVPSDTSPIDAMCEVTGGRSYCITSHRMLNQCIDSLVQKVQNGVVINFEKIGPDPPPPEEFTGTKDENGIIKDDLNTIAIDDNRIIPTNTNWHTCRRMIYVPKANKSYCVGFWPIPESFWPEVTASVLPARSAHPNVKFTCTSSEPLVIENLPFDKYELEPSPLTQFILSRKQPKTCWQVFVANSYKNSEVGHPFGYLKASTNLTCVNLFVMPYNYPVLLPLLDELSKVHRWKPTNEWRTQFQNYMRTLPAYYAGPLRRALTRMGTPLALAQTLIPENSETLSYSVSNYLKRLKNQAKVEYDKLCSEIAIRQNAMSKMSTSSYSEQIRILNRVNLKKDLISHPLLVDKFSSHRDQIPDQSTGTFLVTLEKERPVAIYKNPFDVPRNRLVEEVIKTRYSFLHTNRSHYYDQDGVHSLPICQMGNYQEYLKRQTPQLREIESAPVRQHMFGNPFKIDKRMMVDEADIDLVGSSSPSGLNRNNKRPNSVAANPTVDLMGGRLPALKRKPGPLPRNFSIRRNSVSTTGVVNEVTTPAPPTTTPLQLPNNSSTAALPKIEDGSNNDSDNTNNNNTNSNNNNNNNNGSLPSPIPWLASIERDLPSFEEKPSLITVNGLDSPSGSERSRSPSPPLEPPPYFQMNDVHLRSNNNPSFNYMSSGALDNTSTTNSFSDLYASPSIFDEKPNSISQILRESNNALIQNCDTKPVKVEIRAEVDDQLQDHELRQKFNRLVRKPGKNFTELFDNIKTLKGTIDVQVEIIKLIIKESQRFKRQHLVEMLEEHIQTLKNVEKK